MEGNASVYQVNPESRISYEGRAELLRTWGADFDQKGGGRGGEGTDIYIYNIKIKIHSSREIEYFVETHLCKLCVILRSRVLRVVCPH